MFLLSFYKMIREFLNEFSIKIDDPYYNLNQMRNPNIINPFKNTQEKIHKLEMLEKFEKAKSRYLLRYFQYFNINVIVYHKETYN